MVLSEIVSSVFGDFSNSQPGVVRQYAIILPATADLQQRPVRSFVFDPDKRKAKAKDGRDCLQFVFASISLRMAVEAKLIVGSPTINPCLLIVVDKHH